MALKTAKPLAKFLCTGASVFGKNGRTISFQQIEPKTDEKGQAMVSLSVHCDGNKMALAAKFEIGHEYEMPALVDLGVPKG